MILQAFGLADCGKCFVDFLPGTDVLWTCSSKSSAEARFCFDILAVLDRRVSALTCKKTGWFEMLGFARLMQDTIGARLLIFKSEDRCLSCDTNMRRTDPHVRH